MIKTQISHNNLHPTIALKKVLRSSPVPKMLIKRIYGDTGTRISGEGECPESSDFSARNYTQGIHQ